MNNFNYHDIVSCGIWRRNWKPFLTPTKWQKIVDVISKHFIDTRESIVQNDLFSRFVYKTVNRHFHTEQRFATSRDCAESCLVIATVIFRAHVRRCVACEFVELRRITVLIAWECAKQRFPSEWDCADMQPAKYVEMREAAACVEMRVASMPPNRGSSECDARRKHAGSAARVRRISVPCIGGSRRCHSVLFCH